MTEPRDERQLAAIMFTDIVGYTSLTERDEARAIKVRERHRAIVGPMVAQFHGELVEATGDESFAVFPSAILAVDCAYAIQAALRQDEDLQLRIGVHLGDVVRREGEVIGEGVNMAARIRPLAEPQGICISDAVYQMVRNRPHISARPLGAQALKNVGERVKVFALSTDKAAAPRRRRPWIAAAAVGLVTTVVLGWWLYAQNRAAILSWVAIATPKLFGSPIEQKIGFATTKDGVRIAYATTGSGPPLVFVLGWATHLEQGIGSPLYERDGPIGYHSRKHLFVRYDGRGFGLSDRDVDDFSLEAKVGDLDAVVQALGLGRFAIYAVSAGGPAAITYAARYPERVSHLILAGSTAGGLLDADSEARQQWDGMLALFRTSWDSPIVRSMMTQFLDPEGDEVDQRIVSEFLHISGDGPAIAGFFADLLNTDVGGLATQVQVPTLVIHGQEDRTIPLESGRRLAALIPRARFEILPGANHFEGTAQSPEMHKLIDAFLAEERPGDGAGLQP
jgi:class 3 adenylate cyclase/pimeloyl-ACP methyl ester carboxylesterase